MAAMAASPIGALGRHRDGPERPPWTALPPTQLGQSQAPPGSHNSQGILATRSGMSPGSAVVLTGAGALWGPHLPTLLAWRRWPGQPGHLWGWPLGPLPTPHLPSSSQLGSAWARRQPGVGKGDSSEWSQVEEGAGLWPKCRLSCHRPGLLATSPAPSPSQAGRASPGLPAEPPPRFRASSCRKPLDPNWGSSPGVPPHPCRTQATWFDCYTEGALSHVSPALGDLGAWRRGPQGARALRGHRGSRCGEEWGWLRVGAGLSKLGLKVRSRYGRGARAPGEEGEVGGGRHRV